MDVLRFILLLASSSFCVGLMVWHSWVKRGRRITLLFFPICFIYAILRGHWVRYITMEQWGGEKPYLFSHPMLEIGGEPVLAIVGWIFTIYLSWCLAERILERLRISQTHLFALGCFAFLSTAGISYVVEAAAHSAHWWSWALSLKNPLFVAVPVIGIIDWAAIISDFLIPFLLFFLSPLRKKRWRWLLFLPFLIHFLSHSPYQFYLPFLGYFFTIAHLMIFLVPFLLALRPPAWARLEAIEKDKSGGHSPARWIPQIAYGILLLVTLGVQVKSGLSIESLIAFGPILMIGLLAFAGFRASVVALVGVLLLSIFHDARWLSAAVIPVFSFFFALATSSDFCRNKSQNSSAPGIPTARYGLMAIAILLSGWISIKEYRYEEACRRYEVDELRNLVFNSSNRSPLDLLKASREIAQKAPHDANSLVDLAKSLDDHQAPLPVIAALYEKVIEIDETYSVPYNNLAAIQFRMGNIQETIRTLEQGHRNQPFDVNLLNNLGFYYGLSGETDKAIQYLNQAAPIKSSDPLIWLNLAQAHLKLSEPDKALSCLEKAEKLAPMNPDVKTVRIIFDLNAGRSGSAISELKTILSQHPHAALARLQLAKLLEAGGMWVEATEEYLKFSEEQSFSVKEWLRIAKIASQAGPEDQIEVLHKAYRSYPQSAAIIGQLAQVSSELNRQEEAVEWYQQLVQIRPDHSIALLNLGAALFELSRYEEALDQTSRAYSLNPHLSATSYNTGLIRLCLDDPEGALTAYEQAVRNDSEKTYLKPALEELRKSRHRIRKTDEFMKIEKFLMDALNEK